MNQGPTPASASATVTGASRRPRTDATWDRIGRFVVLERLGRGGMGQVVAAYDPELDRRVAIKLLHANKSERSHFRLIREAQAMARLSHPNVVQVYDVGEYCDQVYIAMELIAGQTIGTWVRAQAPSWREIVNVFVAAGRGLAAAHAVGLVHRDFKPDNVLVAQNGRVCVADFGIASYDEGQDAAESPSPRGSSFLTTPITATGAVLGTPRYMSPEQHRGEVAGAPADQFSFCVALHEALFGELPFGGSTLSEITTNVLDARYVAPTDSTRAPRWVCEVIRRGMHVDPNARYVSVEVLLEHLTDDPDARRRRRVRQATVGAVVVSGIGLGVWGIRARVAAPDCARGSEVMASVWGPARKAAMARAFQTAGKSLAVGADAAFAATVDAYAEHWAAAHHSTCVAHDDGGVSDGLLDRAMACLDRRADALEQLLQVVESGDLPSLDNAAPAAARLPRLGDCTDREALALDVAPPRDPKLAQTVESIRRDLVRTAVVHDAGATETAVAALDALTQRGVSADYDPLTAELGLTTGRLAMQRGDWTTAQAQLRVASARGVSSGVDLVAAEAEARLLFVQAILAERPLDGLAGADLTNALAERVGDPAWLRALIENNIGTIYGMAGDRDRAQTHFLRSQEAAVRAEEIAPSDRAGSLVNLALLADDPERRDALFVTAEAIAARAFGAGHFERLDIAITRAEHRVDPTAALEDLAPVCRTLRTRSDADPMRCFACSWREAELRDLLDDAGAAEAATSAAACLESPTATAAASPMTQALAAKARAMVNVLDEHPDAALAALDAAEALLAPKRSLPWIAAELAEVASLRARAHERLLVRARSLP